MSLDFVRASGQFLSKTDVSTLRFDTTTDWTMLAFIFADTNGIDQTLGISKWGTGTKRQFRVRINSDNTVTVYQDAGTVLTTSFTIDDEVWKLIAVSNRGSDNLVTLRIIDLNSVTVNVDSNATGNGNDANLTNDLQVAAINGSNDEFNGKHAFVAYIDRNMSLAEVQQYRITPYRTYCQLGGQSFIPCVYPVAASLTPDWGGVFTGWDVNGTGNPTIKDNPRGVGPLIGFDQPLMPFTVAAGGALSIAVAMYNYRTRRVA